VAVVILGLMETVVDEVMAVVMANAVFFGLAAGQHAVDGWIMVDSMKVLSKVQMDHVDFQK